MTEDEAKAWFEKCGKLPIFNGVVNYNPSGLQHITITIEDLFLAFRARMKAEEEK